jgi:hypothetical protein
MASTRVQTTEGSPTQEPGRGAGLDRKPTGGAAAPPYRRPPPVGQNCCSAHFRCQEPENRSIDFQPLTVFGFMAGEPSLKEQTALPDTEENPAPSAAVGVRDSHRSYLLRALALQPRFMVPIHARISEVPASREPIPCNSRRQEAQTPRKTGYQSLLTSAATVRNLNARPTAGVAATYELYPGASGFTGAHS